MERFVARHASLVTSVLSGFDRLVFRGALRSIRDRGMQVFLWRSGVPLVDFGEYARAASERVKAAALREAHQLGRPIQYLSWASTDKEARARELLQEHPVDRGLICALTAVEPCMSFEYHRSPNPRERGLRLVPRKCLHVYKYFIHPLFGFMSARIQTWFPFDIQICLNGREWLARQLARRHSEFERADNCFTWLKNPQLAQRLMDEQRRTEWPESLTRIARSMNPLHEEIFRAWPMSYYWVAYQTEWATDLAFNSSASLAGIFPALVRHAMLHFKSPDVLRFLGRTVRFHWKGEVISSFKERPEGVRVKHWVNGNSIKMYDKAGNILRVETTIGNTKDFAILRPRHDEHGGELVWRNLRKGVADLHRRCDLSQRSNERYLDALSVVDDTTPCSRIFDSVARPVIDGGRRFRALRIGDPEDVALLQTVSRGEFAIAGFRNRDLRRLLDPSSAEASPEAQRRSSARFSRRLRFLRAHGLIRKVQRTHRYQLTKRGQLLCAALFAVRDATLKQLVGSAAA